MLKPIFKAHIQKIDTISYFVAPIPKRHCPCQLRRRSTVRTHTSTVFCMVTVTGQQSFFFLKKKKCFRKCTWTCKANLCPFFFVERVEYTLQP